MSTHALTALTEELVKCGYQITEIDEATQTVLTTHGHYTVEARGRMIEQHAEEFAWWLHFVTGRRSLLEIGSANGNSLREMAKVMLPGGRVRSIDRPRGETELVNLLDANEEIRCTHSAEVFLANSKDVMPQHLATWGAPYDVVFIDGGHDYPTVKSDWENYGMLGKIVGIHDIGGNEGGPEILWRELKAAGLRTEEMVCSGMGIGVVLRG